MSTADQVDVVGTSPRGRRISFRVIRRQPVAIVALLFIVMVTVSVALAGVIAPYDPLEQNLQQILQGPSAQHWLGTDTLGRDVLSRLLYGGQPALLGVLIALIFFLAFGIMLGVMAGYLGGWVDRAVALIVDLFMAMPSLVIILAVLAVFSQSQIAAMTSLGVMASGNLIRIVRGAVLSVREELFISAAIVSGLSTTRVMGRHVLPSVVSAVLVQASIFCGAALSIQTGLGFLGVADSPPAPSWGGMIGEAAGVLANAPLLLLTTGGIVVLMTCALWFLGDGLRDFVEESRKPASAPLFHRVRRVARSVETVPAAEGALLSVHDYSIGFRSSDGAVTDTVSALNWSITPGEILGLVGESGSGKTVTALSLLGLLPATGVITSGQARLGDIVLSDCSERDYERIRGARIGLVSQEPMVSLDPSFTIGSQLEEVLRVHRRGARSERKRLTLELLRRVQLMNAEDLVGKYPHELSGGMIQRVAIAIALAGNPELLIADEPTTALDVTVQAEILDLLRDLRAQTGMAIILVTHDLGVVADLCDRVLIMSRGRIVEEGPVEDIFYQPVQEYTKALIRNTPSMVERS